MERINLDAVRARRAILRTNFVAVAVDTAAWWLQGCDHNALIVVAKGLAGFDQSGNLEIPAARGSFYEFNTQAHYDYRGVKLAPFTPEEMDEHRLRDRILGDLRYFYSFALPEYDEAMWRGPEWEEEDAAA